MARSHSFHRLPDSGSLDIKDYDRFLRESRIAFEERWDKLIKYKDEITDFDVIKHLGNGTYGSVVLVKYKKNNQEYAMKIINKLSVVKADQIEYLRNEKKVLQCTNFPFMLYLHCCFKDHNSVYLVMPYMPYELYDLLEHLKKFGESEARFYVCQVVLAIEYLHHLDLIYRDLKPENVLLDAKGYVKLADFGFCKRLMGKRTFTLCGTPDFIAPEVLQNKGYGFAVDWWSCGVFTYELVAGFTPFHGKTVLKTCSNIMNGKFRIPKTFSIELNDLVQNLIMPDLSKRYGNMKNGAKEIKSHKWFKTVNWLAILNRSANVPFQPPLPIRPKGHDMSSSLRTAIINSSVHVPSSFSDVFEDF